MTHDELMVIPEWPTQFGYREIERDGLKVRVPVAPMRVAMFDPAEYLDAQGRGWLVGKVNGVQYRQLVNNYSAGFEENRT